MSSENGRSASSCRKIHHSDGATRRWYWRGSHQIRQSLVELGHLADRARERAGDFHASGDLNGSGSWTVSPDGPETLTRYDWDVSVGKPSCAG